MRTALFAICFTTGIALMVLSGYLPKAASARESTATAPEPPGPPAPNSPFTVYSRRPEIPPDDGERTYRRRPAITAEFEEPLPPEPNDWPEPNEPNLPDGDEMAENLAAALDGLDEVPPIEDPNVEVPEGPAASAGDDRILWIGWNEIKLDGSGSTGDGLKYAWKQTGGPATLHIRNTDRAVTTATGLPISPKMGFSGAIYAFELTVTDELGNTASDTVEMVVLPAPDIVITPTANRYYARRDSYLLPHFEAWTTNTESFETTFRVQSPTDLHITKVAGSPHRLSRQTTDEGYLFEITLMAEGEEATSWAEFLIDTEEKIPGIIQLGVDWY